MAATREGEPVFLKLYQGLISMGMSSLLILVERGWEGELSSSMEAQYFHRSRSWQLLKIVAHDLTATASVEVFRGPSVLLYLEIMEDTKAREDESIYIQWP